MARAEIYLHRAFAGPLPVFPSGARYGRAIESRGLPILNCPPTAERFIEQMFQVIIVDDHPMIRLGLKSALREKGIQVVGECNSGQDLLELLGEGIEANAVLLDIDLPGANGLDVLSDVREKYSNVAVFIFSHHSEPRVIEQALRQGARGYFSKEDSIESISVLLRGARNNDVTLSPRIQSALFRGRAQKNPLDSLTVREKEVLKLVAHGLKHKEIAERLDISVRTVDFHRQNLKEKLEAESIIELVRIAEEGGLME